MVQSAPDTNAPTVSSDEASRVQVTLLLDGGQKFTLTLKRDAALLGQLIGNLTLPPEKRASALFQIPLSAELGSLTFSGDRLSGLLTNPPIMVRRKEDETNQSAPS